MYTLQILDRGQTFLHPLDDGVILLGSGPTADVVLREADVAPVHARIEAHAGGARLVAVAATRVNGQVVARADLALGDRIEIGRAVLVVGRSVTRAASADDVLTDVVPRARRPAPKSRLPVVPIVVALAVAGLAAWLAFGTPSTQRVRDELAAIQRLRLAGHLDRAGAAIDKLQREWADAQDDRLQRLQAERDAIAAVEATVVRLTKGVLDPADHRGYAEWSQELQRLEAEGTPAEQVAARRVRSNLTATMLERPKLPQPAANPVAGQPAVPKPAPQPAASAPAAPAPGIPALAAPSTPVAGSGAAAVPAPAASLSATAKIDTGEADRLAGQGLFAQAIALLQASLGEQDNEAEVARLQGRAAAVREQAVKAMAALLAEAGLEVADGDPREGAKVLHAARHRFPPDGPFLAIDDEIRRCEALAAAKAKPPAPAAPGAAPVVDELARSATLGAVRMFMDQVRAAEEQGAFATAAQQLRAAADAVRERDPDFAARLVLRADEAQLLAAWHDAVAGALQAGRTLATTQSTGQAITLTRVEGAALLASASGAKLSWHDIGPAGVLAIADQLKVTGPAALGAAALLYKQGQSDKAEALLAKLERTDPTCKEGVDRVIARGRGEPFDGKGYALGKDGFQSVRSLEIQKQAAALAARLDAVLRDKNAEVRATFWTETLAAGPEAVQVLVAAMQRELQKQVARLDTGTLRKQVDKLAAQRALLDEARKTAKDLIFDEKTYFYPYKPPAVSSDRYAEYMRVQAEVDRRVAALRTVWTDDRVRVRVPASLRADLDRLDWVAKGLADLGELDHGMLAQVEWVRALPPGDSVGVRDFCTTVAERADLEDWRRIEAYNQIVGKTLGSSQRELLKITNEYRAMFHHRPLAIVATICAASQGHAEEMSRLGYFAHMSPTPGRKTPYDRMRLAGYQFGVSENIALVDGAMGAHVAWCHSSGHHRNLLDPAHREIGVGADGRYWVQNFGSGTGHRDDPAWGEARPNAR